MLRESRKYIWMTPHPKVNKVLPMPSKKKIPVSSAPKKSLPIARMSNLKTKPVAALQSAKKVTKAPTKKPLTTAKKEPLIAVKVVKGGWNFSMHFLIAGIAIGVLFGLAYVEKGTFATNPSSAQDLPAATIGLEHTAPLSLSVLFARKDGAGYASITNGSNETIHLSLPSGWSRMEVTGASLADVKQEIPVFGFTRWTLPGKAGIKLMLEQSPGAVLFDSTSSATTAVDLKTVDLTTSETSSRVILVQKQSYVTMWGAQD